MPLIERLPELTPDHRVVIELSELQLPTLSRGTTVAVYTNVTSDHLDRHGSVEAYRRVKRRLAELVDPDGALVLNIEDPVVGGYAGLGTAPVGALSRRPAGARRARGAGRMDRRGSGRAAAAGGRRDGRDRPGRRDHAGRRADDPRPPQRGQRAGRDRGRPPVRRRARRDPRGPRQASPASSTGSSRSRCGDGVRFVNDSQGTQPDAVIAALRAFAPPVVLIAGGRDKGVDLRALAAVAGETAAAAVLIGESGPALGELLAEAGVARTVQRGLDGRGRRDGRRARPRRAGAITRRAPSRPCC